MSFTVLKAPIQNERDEGMKDAGHMSAKLRAFFKRLSSRVSGKTSARAASVNDKRGGGF
jgi:hypothetical protein